MGLQRFNNFGLWPAASRLVNRPEDVHPCLEDISNYPDLDSNTLLTIPTLEEVFHIYWWINHFTITTDAQAEIWETVTRFPSKLDSYAEVRNYVFQCGGKFQVDTPIDRVCRENQDLNFGLDFDETDDGDFPQPMYFYRDKSAGTYIIHFPFESRVYASLFYDRWRLSLKHPGDTYYRSFAKTNITIFNNVKELYFFDPHGYPQGFCPNAKNYEDVLAEADETQKPPNANCSVSGDETFAWDLRIHSASFTPRYYSPSDYDSP